MQLFHNVANQQQGQADYIRHYVNDPSLTTSVSLTVLTKFLLGIKRC